jgi:hypothetical protein
VRDAGNRKVGGLFVLHDVTAEHATLRSAALHTLLALVGIGALLTAALALAAQRLVFARVVRLRRRLEALADRARLPPGRVVDLSDDEIAGLEALLERVLFPSRRRDAAPRAEPRADDGTVQGGAPRSDESARDRSVVSPDH